MSTTVSPGTFSALDQIATQSGVADLTNARLASFVWETRYKEQSTAGGESSVEDTWRRVAQAVASREPQPQVWVDQFLEILRDYRFLPGGRILAGAGSGREVTLCNCFVMGPIEDSIEGIFAALREGAITMQHGGGVGYDFSTLRPHGARARTSGTTASGPVSFLQIWDAMCAALLSTGARRGAMMATLRCDHPDIEEFITAKRTPAALQHFNLSVLVSDRFMQAVRDDTEWPLVFPERELADGGRAGADMLERTWSGHSGPVLCRVHKTVRARALWTQLCNAASDYAEPGVLYIDRINALNNLGYCELLSATNPCAEEPLPAYGACDLGSINLCAFVVGAFTPAAHLAESAIAATTRTAVRFLDNVLDISRFPLPLQRQQALWSRRLGLGITGLADALTMLGLRYDSTAARQCAARIMRVIRDTAYETSVELAAEKGSFPALDVERYLERPFIAALPGALHDAIRRQGIRNSHLLAIAPAGTISLLAGNVSSGIEPMFGIESMRRVLDPQGRQHDFQTTNYAYARWRAEHSAVAQLPDCFVNGEQISPSDHLLMQAALQPYVDGSISKTITLPDEFARDALPEVFAKAFELGLKGCTVYRTRVRADVIMNAQTSEPSGPPMPIVNEPACLIDRECD